MKRGRERKLEAYRDGALGEPERKRIERALAADPEAARYVERSAALGTLIRDAWSEGPAAPAADRLLASIAPEMRRIDAERAPRPAASRALEALFDRVRDSVDALSGRWLAASGASAVLLVAFLMLPQRMQPAGSGAFVPGTVERFAAAAPSVPVQLASESQDAGPRLTGQLGWPSAVYDLSQEDVPLMVSEQDGGVVILIGEPLPVPGEDISGFGSREGVA